MIVSAWASRKCWIPIIPNQCVEDARVPKSRRAYDPKCLKAPRCAEFLVGALRGGCLKTLIPIEIVPRLVKRVPPGIGVGTASFPAAPPSEPDVRISRIRLSSRWVTPEG
ncbi:MAG: hypothetical protein AB1664_16125, partial [Thermodesulfobacteriota bacterium]